MFDIIKIGENIKDFAAESRTDAAGLAAVTGVEVSNVYRWYKNALCPSLKNIIKIADYYDVAIDYIIGRENENRAFLKNSIPPFCKRFAYILKQSGKTKAEISKATGISRSQLHYWLHGKRNPTLHSIIKLAEYFGFSIDYTIGREI